MGTEGDSSDSSHRSPVLTLDTVFGILSNQRQRYVLYYLQNRSGDAVEFEDLVEYVVMRIDETENGDPPVAQREEIVAALHHIDLPKLTDQRIIEFDSRSGTIRYWGNDLLETYLARAAAEELK